MHSLQKFILKWGRERRKGHWKNADVKKDYLNLRVEVAKRDDYYTWKHVNCSKNLRRILHSNFFVHFTNTCTYYYSAFVAISALVNGKSDGKNFDWSSDLFASTFSKRQTRFVNNKSIAFAHYDFCTVYPWHVRKLDKNSSAIYPAINYPNSICG